jgi:hypothetical protein
MVTIKENTEVIAATVVECTDARWEVRRHYELSP